MAIFDKNKEKWEHWGLYGTYYFSPSRRQYDDSMYIKAFLELSSLTSENTQHPFSFNIHLV